MNRPVRVILVAVLSSGAGSSPALAACNPDMLLSRPDSRYVDNGDGTVTDTVTSLMWKQCAEGLSGPDCTSGAINTYTWQGALQRAEDVNAGSAGENLGHTDWRLPNLKELRSLAELAWTVRLSTRASFRERLWPSSGPRLRLRASAKRASSTSTKAATMRSGRRMRTASAWFVPGRNPRPSRVRASSGMHVAAAPRQDAGRRTMVTATLAER